MEIYLEETILLNTFIYLSFLCIVSSCFKFKLRKTKCFFACIISSVFTVLFNMFNLNLFLLYSLEFLVTMFLLTFSFRNLNLKKLLQSLIMFIIISNVFKGVTHKALYNSNIFLSSPIPIYLFFTLLVLFTIVARKCIDIIIFKSKSASNICKIELRFKDKKIYTSGYLDTGNNLTVNNQPVSIINFKLFNSLTGISLTNYLSKNYQIANQQYIKVSTITGSNNLLSFQVDELKIISNHQTQTIKNPSVALSLKLNSANDYDVILNNNYLI